MSLPDEIVVQRALLVLLDSLPDNTIASFEAYRLLEPKFPSLTRLETAYPFNGSPSRFAYVVRTAVEHLKADGWLLPTEAQSGRGMWTLSAKAIADWRKAFPSGDEFLAELMA